MSPSHAHGMRARSRNGKPAPKARRRLWVEFLEDRTAPSGVNGEMWGTNGIPPYTSGINAFLPPAMSVPNREGHSLGGAAFRPVVAPGEENVTRMVWRGQEIEVLAGEWIARFDVVSGSPAARRSALEQKLSGIGLPVKVESDLGASGLFQLRASPGVTYEALARALSSVPGYRYIEPNVLLRGAANFPNDSQFPELYGLHNTGQPILGIPGTPDADVDAPEAWDITTGSASVVVGVIDSGIDFTHPDLIDNIWTNPNEIPGNSIDDDGNGFVDDVHGWDFFDGDNDPTDQNGHGTHVSGTIGATGNNTTGVAGVNWDVSIMPLRFLGASNSGPLSAAIEAINYATMMRQSGVNLRVTNNSWGGPEFQALFDAISAHAAADILFIAAAGNGGFDGIGDDNDSFPAFPASYPLDNIISVAATDNQDLRAIFSNYGATSVDLGAPGVLVYSTVPTFLSPTGYAYFNGTSMATPHVAGVAALAWSLAPDATAQEIKNAILAGVDPIAALNGITVTGGRLNAFNTLLELGLSVSSTSPAAGSVVSARPTEFVVHFSHPYHPDSIQAGDLTVNGITADSVDLTDENTVTFTFTVSPVSAQGLQTIAIAPGAIDPDEPGLPFRGYTGTFRYDILPLAVVSTGPPTTGGVFTLPGPFAYDVRFNEPVDADSVQPTDLALSGLPGATAVAVAVAADGLSARFTIAGVSGEGTLNASIGAGAITDRFGNPGTAFSASYAVDFGTAPYPVPLTPVAPRGSLIYDPVQAGTIGQVGDTDTFTITVDAGQTITVLVESTPGLRSTVRITGPDGVVVASTTAPAAGDAAILQTVRVPGLIGGIDAPRTYRITVGGADGTTGGYTLKLVLNAALEYEGYSETRNDTLVSAQSLAGSLITLQNDIGDGLNQMPARGAVVGRLADSDVTVPAALETADGNTNNAWPFHIGFFGQPSMRYQQIYSAGAFSDSGVIDEVRFRSNGGAFSASGIDVRIRLGYAATTVATVSPTFASNIGAGLVTVFDGLLSLSSSGVASLFDVVIDVADLFDYDPALGDLLLDIEVRNAAFSQFLDASGFGQQTVTQRVFSFPGDVNATTGIVGIGDSTPYGLVTQFGFESDPADIYQIDLKSGQGATVALTALGGGSVQVELLGPTGTPLALGSGGVANVDRVIRNFLATANGTYYLRVTGTPGVAYSLVVTRNAAFDSETNNDIGSAQDLISPEAAGRRWVLGHVEVEQGRLFATGGDPFAILELDPATGAIIHAIPSPIPVGGGPDGLAFDGSSLFLVNSFVSDQLWELDPDTGAVRDVDSLGSPGFLDGVAVLNGLVYVTNSDTNQILVFDPASDAVTRIMNFGIDLGGGLAAAVGPDALVATVGFGSVVEIDPTTGSVLGSFTPAFGPLLGVAVVDGEVYLGGFFGGIAVYTRAGAFQRFTPVPFGITALGGDDVGSGVGSDFYRITAAGNQTIEIATRTPAGLAGEFVNALDPIIRLYDSAGNLLATNDNGAADGRNALLTYKVPRTGGGTFYVEITASAATPAPTSGEYILSVKGATGTLPAFQVAATNPADGSRVRGPVTEVRIDFNDNVLMTTLAASDVRIDGKVASGITVVDGDTAVFTVAQSLSEGLHTIAISAGVIRDVQGTPIAAFTGTFYNDVTAPRVVSSSIQQGDVLTAGLPDLTVTIGFSEAMNAAAIDIFDVSLVGQFFGLGFLPSSVTFDATGTVMTLTFAGINLPEDVYTLTLGSGDSAFEDLVGWNLDGEALAWPIPPNQSGDGVEGGNFAVTFLTDAGLRSVPVPLSAVNPLGSLIYRTPFVSTGVVAGSGDTDDWTIDLDPGQTITVLVGPIGELIGTVEVRGPGGGLVATVTGTGPGDAVVLQTAPTTTAGTFTITFGGALGTVGGYTFELVLNAALETETYGGPSNDDLASAQSIDGSFIPLPTGDRGAVIGRTPVGNSVVVEQEPNNGPVTTLSAVQNLDDSQWSLGDDPAIFDSTILPHVSVVGTGDGTFDYYSFTVPTAGAVGIFDIDFTFALDSLLYLYDSAGNLIGFSDDNSGDPGSFSFFDSLIFYTFPAAGTYVVGVGSYPGVPVPIGAAYTLHVSVAGHPTGSAAGAFDTYSVTLGSGQAAAVAVTSLSGGNVTVELLDASGSVVATSGTGTSASLDFAGGLAGTYYLRVSGDSNTEYSLVVTRGAVFDVGGNTGRTTARTLDLSGGSAAVLGHVSPVRQLVINATDTGWYTDFGFHDPTNTNYYTGLASGFGVLRGFWTFDLGSLSGSDSVLNARLQLFNPFISDTDFSETLAFYSVTTPVSEILAGGFDRTDIYDDLGTGTLFGQREVLFFEDFTLLDVQLSADAIAALLAGAGNPFAIGATLTTVDPTRGDQYVFGNSGSPSDARRLVLDFESKDYYRIDLADARTVDVATGTPASGPGEFINNLDPLIRIYDADGNLLFTDDNGAADGRNARLAGLNLAAGTYYIVVETALGTAGEYTLSVNTGIPSALVPPIRRIARAIAPLMPDIGTTIECQLTPHPTLDATQHQPTEEVITDPDPVVIPGPAIAPDEALAAVAPISPAVLEYLATASDIEPIAHDSAAGSWGATPAAWPHVMAADPVPMVGTDDPPGPSFSLLTRGIGSDEQSGTWSIESPPSIGDELTDFTLVDSSAGELFIDDWSIRL
ncbi:MAG TPA: S8 family serine peptidase [Fimbriiglobus sp.]|nr:S8 family serine peptidase [Fimbriiglobus sp.]